MIRIAFLVSLLLLLPLAPIDAGAQGATGGGGPAVPWPTSGWETAAPEAQGVAPGALAELVDFGAANGMDSLLVVRHGKIVTEAYYAPFRAGLRHSVNSVTKGVVGTLAGIAFKDGRLPRLDQPMVEFFPERTIAGLDAAKRAITVASLLDMTSGLDWQEPLTDAPPTTMLQMEQSADWVGFVLDRPMAQAPGVGFEYDSGTWLLLSAILAKQTGMDTLAYARQTLFGPLGIDDVRWRQDPQGVRNGGYGLFLQPRDMAKIGYLYLQHGAWDGKQLLAPTWVDRVFAAPVDMHLSPAVAFRYADGWWSIPSRHATMAVGFLRQLIIVLPEIDAVVVVTGSRHYPFLQLIDRVIAAASSGTPLPADPVGTARLAERVRAAAIEQATAVAPASALAPQVSGKTWQFAPNNLGVRSIRLDFGAGEPRIEAVLASRPGAPPRGINGPIGLDGRYRISETSEGNLVGVKGRWLSDESFEISSRSINEGVAVTLRLVFRGNQVDASLSSNQGFAAQLQGRSAD